MPATPLTLQDLKSDLWNCAQILRGSAIDRTDWKGYILPLLFFKRISDVWDEETAEARETYGGVDLDDFAELHRFTLPGGCHWRDVRETPSNVGAALARAMRTIERTNPDTLTRVFGAADWGNREMLGDELLKDLIEGLSGVPLGNTAVESDILGDVRLRHRQSAVLTQGVGPRGVGGGPVGPRRIRSAAGELRRLRLGPADGGLDGGNLGPHGGRAAAGGTLPHGGRRTHPAGAARAGPDRGGNRACAQHLLRHRPGPGRDDAPPHEAARAAEDRLRRVLVEDGWLE